MLFVGTHARQLDDKGRLALPATFRTSLGEHCYLVYGADTCLDLLPAGDFEAMAAGLMDKVERGEISRQRQRTVSGSATLVTIDRQGRIVVDERMRTYAGLALGDKVVVTGNFDRIEIWTPANRERIELEGLAELAGGRP